MKMQLPVADGTLIAGQDAERVPEEARTFELFALEHDAVASALDLMMNRLRFQAWLLFEIELAGKKANLCISAT